MVIRAILALAALVALSSPTIAQTVPAGPTLAQVRQRGLLNCGVPPEVPGFGTSDASGQWRGLEVDICRAIAAASLERFLC